MKFTLYTAAAALLAVLSTTDVMADAPGCETAEVTLNQNGGFVANVSYETCDGKKGPQRVNVSNAPKYQVKKGTIFSVIALENMLYQGVINKNTIINCAGALGTTAKCEASYPG